MADEEKTEKPQKQRQPRQDRGQGKGAEKGAGGGGGGGGRKGRQRGAEAQAAAVPEAPAEPEPKIPARLRIRYEGEIVPSLMRELKIENRMRVPRLDKIVINMGLGEARENVKILDSAVEELGQITGQKPVITRARKAISNFKLRQGMPIGAMVTLRRERMYEFFDRLVNVALPRVRDFRGISDKSFDGRGNYSLGLREHTIFPELNLDKVEKVKGMTISVITTAKSDFEGLTLLKALGMPFRGVGEQRAGAQAA
jgi:large subunit ribosomal protein L5